jgi:hypothetical protein
MTKNEIDLGKHDYKMIIERNDLEKIHEFLAKLYTFLTSKKYIFEI